MFVSHPQKLFQFEISLEIFAKRMENMILLGVLLQTFKTSLHMNLLNDSLTHLNLLRADCAIAFYATHRDSKRA